MKTKSAAIDIDPIRLQRQYYRDVFWAAYDVFLAKTNVAIPSLTPTGAYTQPGGPHDPAWERWARWRADFHLLGQRKLPETEERIFTLHFCMGLSERGTVKWVGLASNRELYGYKSMIAEKMGRHIEEAGLWPISAYLDTNTTDQQLEMRIHGHTFGCTLK